jgi:hypothetical protein
VYFPEMPVEKISWDGCSLACILITDQGRPNNAKRELQKLSFWKRGENRMQVGNRKFIIPQRKKIFSEFLSQEMTRKTNLAIIWMLMTEMNWLHKYYDRHYYFLT